MSHTLNLKKFSFLVYGLGSTGLSIIRYFKKRKNFDFYVWDDNIKLRKKFGFKKLNGYDTTRLYAYLAERYLSFWFKKYTKSLEWPLTFIKYNEK